MAIQLALSPESRWDVTVPDYLDAASSAGFASVGLAAAHATETTAAALTSRHLSCHEVLSLRASSGDLLLQAQNLAASAAMVGAQWILAGGFRARPTAELLVELQRAADVVSDAGAGLAIEFSPAGWVSSIPRAVDVAEALGRDGVKIIIDAWHFFHGKSTWSDLAAIPVERIAYIQFTDALAPASDDEADETMNRRAMPGDGVLELDRFATTLLERGWDGVVSVEVLSRELRELPVAEFARRAYESTAPYWR